MPVLFGEPAVLGELATDGNRQPVLGGPADLPPDQWLYLAYGGAPKPGQRRTAEQVMELAYGKGSNRCSVSVFRPFLAVRTPFGSLLLARDARGWYVTAVARGVAGPPVRVFGELRRAATWWQAADTAAA